MAKSEGKEKLRGRNGLSLRQQVFVREYIANGGNATAAHIAAGYKSTTPKTCGCETRKIPAVAKEIDRIMRKNLKKLDVNAEKTIQAMANVAFLDPRKAFKADGSIVPIHELPDEVAGAISSISVRQTETGNVYEYKFNDRCKAHDSLARHFGLYKPEEVKHDHRVTISIEI